MDFSRPLIRPVAVHREDGSSTWLQPGDFVPEEFQAQVTNPKVLEENGDPPVPEAFQGDGNGSEGGGSAPSEEDIERFGLGKPFSERSNEQLRNLASENKLEFGSKDNKDTLVALLQAAGVSEE